MLIFTDVVLWGHMSETPKNEPNYNLRRAAVAGSTIIGVAGAGALVGQTIENHIRDQDRRNAIIADYENDQDFLAEIVDEAQKPADPLDIQGTFTITGNEALIDAGHSIAINLEDYKDNRDLIDYTLLQSALAQGVHHEGDTFAVTSADIKGQETYIIQPVTEDSEQSPQS